MTLNNWWKQNTQSWGAKLAAWVKSNYVSANSLAETHLNESETTALFNIVNNRLNDKLEMSDLNGFATETWVKNYISALDGTNMKV